MGFILWGLSELIRLYILLIVVWCLLTWFPGAIQSSLGQFITKLVSQYLSFFDRFVPALGGVSFAPIIAIIVLYVVQYGIQGLGYFLGV